VAVDTLPDNDQLASSQHRVKRTRRNAEGGELGAANDAVVGA
jgi:hypothetical protein